MSESSAGLAGVDWYLPSQGEAARLQRRVQVGQRVNKLWSGDQATMEAQVKPSCSQDRAPMCLDLATDKAL